MTAAPIRSELPGVTVDGRGAARRIAADIRLVPGRTRWLRIAALIAIVAIVPLNITSSVWLSVLALAGISAIVVIGLNVLTGYAGQISLGQAVFVGVGAYTAAYLGDRHGLPMPLWLLGTAAVGAVIGALVGPIALRVRGPYLIFVSLALLAVSQWIFVDWTSFTHGSTGEPAFLKTSVGPVNFSALEFGGRIYSSAEGLCLLIWIIVLVCLLLASNIDRSRSGRAMRAVRDNEASAAAVGISLGRTKIAAFAVSASMAAVAGALLAAQTQYVSPGSFDLNASITYLIILMLGGRATRLGPVVGALAVGALQQGLTNAGPSLPLISANGSQGSFTVADLTQVILGLVLVAVLVLQPRGLSAAWSITSRIGHHVQGRGGPLPPEQAKGDEA